MKFEFGYQFMHHKKQALTSTTRNLFAKMHLHFMVSLHARNLIWTHFNTQTMEMENESWIEVEECR